MIQAATARAIPAAALRPPGCSPTPPRLQPYAGRRDRRHARLPLEDRLRVTHTLLLPAPRAAATAAAATAAAAAAAGTAAGTATATAALNVRQVACGGVPGAVGCWVGVGAVTMSEAPALEAPKLARLRRPPAAAAALRAASGPAAAPAATSATAAPAASASASASASAAAPTVVASNGGDGGLWWSFDAAISTTEATAISPATVPPTPKPSWPCARTDC